MSAQISPRDAAKSDAPETFEVQSRSVACDGGPMGHPKVYLQIGDEGFIDCPYCDRRFVLRGGADAH
jgi:uncharacterized Zn-finger protein